MMLLMFAVFVRYNKTPIGKIFSRDFKIGLDLRSQYSSLNLIFCHIVLRPHNIWFSLVHINVKS